MANTTGIAATRSRARLEQSLYSSAVRMHGKDSPQAKEAEAIYWCARLCTLIEDSIAQHPLTDEQRQRIAGIALGLGEGTAVIAHFTEADNN